MELNYTPVGSLILLKMYSLLIEVINKYLNSIQFCSNIFL